MPYPKAVLLDLDDTLISFDGVSEPAWQASCAAFIGRYKPAFSAEALRAKIREKQSWYWADPQRHKTGRENMKQARRDVVGLALQGEGIPQEAIHWLADDYTARHNAAVCLYPNTLPTLERLRQSAVRMILITNGSSQGQRAKLSRFGLEGFFEHILIDQELGFGKPDIRVFQHALDLLSLPSWEVWMVGDNPVWDIMGPQALGIRAVWHDYKQVGIKPGAAIIPDRVIHEIGQLLSVDFA